LSDRALIRAAEQNRSSRYIQGRTMMISNKEVAQYLSQVMIETGSRLNEFLYEVQEKCSEADFKRCKRAVGSVLGTIAIDVLNPLYSEHPDIKPEEYYLPRASKPDR
jgi:hypothetical protein